MIGYHDLNRKPGFKLGMQVVDNRWYLYVAHFWHRGWSVLDVTDPTLPVLENFIPGPADTWTVQLQVADGRMICALEKPQENWGIPPGRPFEEGAVIFDIHSDPVQPKQIARYRTGGTGTHRNFYAGGKYAFMCSNFRGITQNCLAIIDVTTPQATEISRWYLPEQKIEPGATPNLKRYLHGPAYVVSDRAYLSYGSAGMIILDISNIEKPELVSRFSFGDLGSVIGCHSAIPLPGRKLVIVNSEAIIEGPDKADSFVYAFIVDISDETKPKVITSLPRPVPSKSLPYHSYHHKPGRFGPHNQHQYQFQNILMNDENTLYMTWFNAGVRMFDIKDKYAPEEIAHFVLEDPKERIGTKPSILTTQSEDILVDSRGYIYVTDKNHGLAVLKRDHT